MIEAATGTGKTAVALAAMELLHREHGDRFRAAIIVPTKVLAHQWRDQLERNLGLSRSSIGELHSDARIEWRSTHPVLIAVVNSARTRLLPVLEGWRKRGYLALLIVDECHRAGSEYNSRIFEGHYDCSLGLSATPERDDRGHEQYVYPGLGYPVYRYPLLNALNDGVLAPVQSINLYVDFDAAEHARWLQLSGDIREAFRNLMCRYPELQDIPDELLLRKVTMLADHEDPLALRIVKLLSDRRALLCSARARLACQEAILKWLAGNGKRALVFHETITSATASYEFLTRALAVRTGLDHSGLHKDVRAAAMEGFRKERHQVLVAVRALDEGVDVPDASVAVIAAGSRSRRQRIQRFGRVLRPAAGKRALLLTVLVRNTPEETAVGGRDSSLIGGDRVRHHRWPGVPVEHAVAAKSSYHPDEPAYSVEDLLTLLELGLWEPGKAVIDRRAQEPSGGYGTLEVRFSPNAWYPVEDVRVGIGMPQHEFDRIRKEIRRAYRRSLDTDKANNPSVIHGSEIDAVRREWHGDERRRFNIGRRR